MGTIEHAYGWETERKEKELWLPGKGKWKRVGEMTLTPVKDTFGHVKGIAICHPEGNCYTTHGASAMKKLVEMFQAYLMVMEQDKPATALALRR